ncbi:MAG: branched-chain amino acid ABC transporter permease [Chloroflexi bacterium]|nr:branched-chain amino acid ABC transporter permease [Chloroflexota bacterium]
MRPLLITVALLALLAGLGFVLPAWIIFLLSLAFARGLAILSVALLLRAGLVSFGQGLFFAASAYTVAFVMRAWGVREAALATALGTAAGVLVAGVTGLLLARYREIFFAMLTLAFSMVLYGILVKAYALTGGSDGMAVATPTIAGLALEAERLRSGLYLLTLSCTAAVAYLTFRYMNSPLGYAARAVRDNEVRLEYLGLSTWGTIYLTYVLAGGLSGLGGALMALNVGHVDPQLAYWTTSGEFVFVALLGGIGNVLAPLGGAVVFEILRAYAFKYAPYIWQMIMGSAMLLIILFMPEGLWTIYTSAVRRIRIRRWSWRRLG